MQSIFLRFLALAVFVLTCFVVPAAAGNGLFLPANTSTILEHIYSGRIDLAIPEAGTMQAQNPNLPLGYMLEAEARWWKIWWSCAEFKY
jgi:hypothetical protein